MGSLIFNSCRQRFPCVNYFLKSYIQDEISVSLYCHTDYFQRKKAYSRSSWIDYGISIPAIITTTHTFDFDLFNKSVNKNIFRHFAKDTTVTHKGVCWNCKKDLDSSVFCSHCNNLQSIDKHADYFQVMGIKRSYQMDQSHLKNQYHHLQSLLHPDKFGSKSQKEQRLSEELSSVVNKAYSTLTRPLDRGLYLLSLYNISIEEGTTDADKIFLMEVMERNEEIENESDPQKLKEFQTNNKNQLDDLNSDITKAFDSQDLILAKKLLTKMKYYNTIDVKIKEIKQKYNIPD